MVWSLPLLLYLQTTTGSIVGSVTDPEASNEPVPDVMVIARGPAGESADLTDQDGHYRIARLAAGTYTVKFLLSPLKVERPGIEVKGGQQRRLDLSMQDRPKLHKPVKLTASPQEIARCEAAKVPEISRRWPLGFPGSIKPDSIMSQFYETESTGFFDSDGAPLPPRRSADPVLEL